MCPGLFSIISIWYQPTDNLVYFDSSWYWRSSLWDLLQLCSGFCICSSLVPLNLNVSNSLLWQNVILTKWFGRRLHPQLPWHRFLWQDRSSKSFLILFKEMPSCLDVPTVVLYANHQLILLCGSFFSKSSIFCWSNSSRYLVSRVCWQPQWDLLRCAIKDCLICTFCLDTWFCASNPEVPTNSVETTSRLPRVFIFSRL